MPSGALSSLTLLPVVELLDLARRGRLRPRLPSRSVWDDRRRLDFLDGLAQGRPAGALVLAPGSSGPSEVRLGRWSLAAPASDEVLWVVDGQQRLGALLEVLRPTGPGESRAEVELSTLRVRPGRPADDRQGELPGLGASDRVPLAVALDPVALLAWCRLHPIDDGPLGRLLAWAEALRHTPLPVYRLATDDPALMVEVIERANATSLDAVDRSALRGDPHDPDRLARSLVGLGFGLLDPETIRRTVRALPASDDPTRWRQASSALRRAIVFTQVNGSIPHVALMPHPVALAVLARFFHLFPQPGPVAREDLRRWLWRSALSLAPSHPTARALEALREGDEDGSARRLLALAPAAPAPDLFALDRLPATHARPRLQLCALASLHPRSLPADESAATSAPVDLTALLDGPDPAGTPLVDAPGHPLGSTLAARALLPRQPASEAAARLLAASPDDRASHAVDDAALHALRAGDHDAFLGARADSLRSLVARFFARQADWPDLGA